MMVRYNFQHRQRGATLIVVLMILLVVTIVGVLAIRVAMTSLNIATNSQIGQLLLQTSDTPNNYFLNQTNYKDITALTGVIGKVIDDQKDPLSHGREYVFCYRPTSNLKIDSILDMTILIPPKATDADDTPATVDTGESNRSGFCNLSQDFGSNRAAVVTQVAVKYITRTNDTTPGADLSRNTDNSKDANVQQGKVDGRVRITTTAILPNYSNTDLDTVQEKCIGSGTETGYINDNMDAGLETKRTVADCLRDYGIPVNTQVQEIDLMTRYVEEKAPE